MLNRFRAVALLILISSPARAIGLKCGPGCPSYDAAKPYMRSAPWMDQDVGLPQRGSDAAYAHCGGNELCKKASDFYLDARERGWAHPYYARMLDIAVVAAQNRMQPMPDFDATNADLYVPSALRSKDASPQARDEAQQRCNADPMCRLAAAVAGGSPTAEDWEYFRTKRDKLRSAAPAGMTTLLEGAAGGAMDGTDDRPSNSDGSNPVDRNQTTAPSDSKDQPDRKGNTNGYPQDSPGTRGPSGDSGSSAKPPDSSKNAAAAAARVAKNLGTVKDAFGPDKDPGGLGPDGKAPPQKQGTGSDAGRTQGLGSKTGSSVANPQTNYASAAEMASKTAPGVLVAGLPADARGPGNSRGGSAGGVHAPGQGPAARSSPSSGFGESGSGSGSGQNSSFSGGDGSNIGRTRRDEAASDKEKETAAPGKEAEEGLTPEELKQIQEIESLLKASAGEDQLSLDALEASLKSLEDASPTDLSTGKLKSLDVIKRLRGMAGRDLSASEQSEVLALCRTMKLSASETTKLLKSLRSTSPAAPGRGGRNPRATSDWGILGVLLKGWKISLIALVTLVLAYFILEKT